jgi:hypothetical protein
VRWISPAGSRWMPSKHFHHMTRRAATRDDLFLPANGVDRHQRVRTFDLWQEFRNGRDLIQFPFARRRSEGDSFLAGPSADNVQCTGS